MSDSITEGLSGSEVDEFLLEAHRQKKEERVVINFSPLEEIAQHNNNLRIWGVIAIVDTDGFFVRYEKTSDPIWYPKSCVEDQGLLEEGQFVMRENGELKFSIETWRTEDIIEAHAACQRLAEELGKTTEINR